MRPLRRFAAAAARWAEGTAGVAAVEFALVASFLAVGMLNVVDIARYGYLRMQVENAAQSGAQAAWGACNSTSKLPATDSTKCSGLASAVTTAVHSTTLASNVSEPSGSPAEGYYCGTTSGTLTLVGTAGTVGSPPCGQPASCSAVSGAANPTAAPGDYVKISVTYTFVPLFGGLSMAALLTTPITKSTWTRMN